jgi:hypothetical protein
MDVAKALYYLADDTKTALLQGHGGMGRRHWSETLHLYHLYFVLELWCWMAQIGNTPLDKLVGIRAPCVDVMSEVYRSHMPKSAGLDP